ncbi:MAG TPA: hypothetical protein PLL17_03160 [Defluviitaleaceae bacterium]|jgi:hypothetical protein|nr:hypothetical protein [Candidatus Epulonipiscium sp.]HOQ16641.1 hypothetical protein [Defluviitaleaceae bacterium]HPT75202.1 hypothetical protein [Defluviitaleaceae bacterium]HQD50120.1 hypothetical protein [Defluviitaleaceae bacterium]
MDKTKLGISVTLLAAAIYFLGAISILPAFILAGYVLLFEGDSWLKKAAVRMAMVVITFGILSVFTGMLQDVFSVLNLTVGAILKKPVEVPLNLDKVLLTVINFTKNALLLVMGFKAFFFGTVQVPFIENSLDRNI